MGFFAPGAFVVGGALLATILATYLLRPRRPSRRVSSTLLWLAALNDVEAQQPWRRIPPSLLLLLQLATMSALIIALARPFVLSTESSGPFSIVLLDASASMQATDVQPSRFEAGRKRVGQIIDALEPTHTLALVSLDAQPRVVAAPTSDHGQLQRALETMQPTAQSANLGAALSLAGTLAEGHADAQITVVGDGAIDRSNTPSGFSVPVRYLGIGSPDPANLAVVGLGTRADNGQIGAVGRVVNYGSQPEQGSLSLLVDGAHYDSRPINVNAGESAEVQWDDLPATAHSLEARLTPAATDNLALDNAAWAVLDGGRATRVLLVSEGNVFLERALALRPGTEVTRVSPADYVSRPQSFDLLVLDGYVPPVLPSGSNVLLLHPPSGNSLIAVGPDIPVSSLSAAHDNDPLLTHVPLDGVHVNRTRRFDPPSWADVVLRSPETPLLVVGEQEGRRMAVLGFDVHQSDLPLQPGFPVLVQHLLDWLVPTSSTSTPVVQVGEPVALSPLPESVSVEVVAPDGQRTQVQPPSPPAPFTATDVPGLYQVVQHDAGGRETSTVFAVNFSNPHESQIAPATDSGAPAVGPRGTPLQAPLEFWPILAGVGAALLALELALAWWQFTAATVRARVALGLRILTAALVVGALAGVAWPQAVDRQATVFVVDLSQSVTESQSQTRAFVERAVSGRGPDDLYGMVGTARGATIIQGLTHGNPLGTFPEQLPGGLASDGTDLAQGLRVAADLLPAGYRPRLVLLSDGQETSGDAIGQARALRARGIEVDVVPLPGASGPEVLVDSVSAPAVVHENERFTVGVRVVSNVATDGTLHVVSNGEPLADQPVSIQPGSTTLTFAAQAPQVGLMEVQATLDASQDTLSQNNSAQAIVEVQGAPRVLVVEQRPGEGSVIGSALTSTGMRVETRAVTDLPDQLDVLGGYAAVILADVSATSLTDAQQTALRAYVRDLGRGLLAIGGDTSFGQGDYIGTPLDDVLPVRSSVRSHRDQGRVALLLVIDRSGSMADDVYQEGTTKLAMARQAASLSAQQLAPRDQVGVLAFDSFQRWMLPLTSVLGLGPTAIDDKLAALEADGGTDIFPALTTAFDAIRQTDATYKHVILLTDGQSCCGGNYTELLDRMRGASVTLSTIAIGGDADQQLLTQLAREGDGRYYFAEHARDIPRLMTRETELATRGPLVEGIVTPRQVGPDSALSALAAGGLPQLGGYLVTSPKDVSEVLLASDTGDPLLARWRYGLGRSVAWTSDLRGRWSNDWLQWPGTPQLFSELVGWTIAPTQGPLRLTLRADGDTGHVTAEEPQVVDAAPAVVHAHVAQPGGAPLELDLAATAPGRYEASFAMSQPGVYMVRVEGQRGGESIGSAEAGLALAYPAEFRQVSPDTRRMDQIARAGGGHVLREPADAFANDLAPVTTPLPLGRLLLLLAILVLACEIALRRLRISPGDIWEWLRHPHRLSLELPWVSERLRPAAWTPGAWTTRPNPPVAPTVRPLYSETRRGTHATPRLAREANDPAADEDDALAATLKWLAARRGSSGDRG